MSNSSDIDINSYNETHKESINCIKESMLDEETFFKLSSLFKVLGDYTRIKLIYALFKNELCVYDIAEVLNMSQSAISHQLSILKSARLVKFRKEEKQVYYSLDDEHINRLFNAKLEHVEHN